MGFELPQFSDEVWDHLLKTGVSVGLERAGVTILVAVRLAGVLFIGPLLGRAVLTWPVRIGLVLLLTAVVTPQLPLGGRNAAVFEFVAHVDAVNAFPTTIGSPWPGPIKMLPGDCLLAVLREAGIGAAMGLGVAIFLSGLKLAGEWFDRHSGLGMGSVLNPEFSSGGSAPAEIVSMFCIATLLVLQPINGHLLVVRLILDTFRALPVGMANLPESLIELSGTIVQQSLILGLRIAMPFVVAMSLLDLTLGSANRSSRWPLAPTAYVLRAGASLLILAATFPGIQEAVGSAFRESLQAASETVVAAESIGPD